MAEGRVDAEQAFAHSLSNYEAKYAKATECLAKDRETLLTFYNFPAEPRFIGAHPHHEPDRIYLRYSEIAYYQDAWLRFPCWFVGDGL